MGRAGRPADDAIGKAVILCHTPKKARPPPPPARPPREVPARAGRGDDEGGARGRRSSTRSFCTSRCPWSRTSTTTSTTTSAPRSSPRPATPSSPTHPTHALALAPRDRPRPRPPLRAQPTARRAIAEGAAGCEPRVGSDGNAPGWSREAAPRWRAVRRGASAWFRSGAAALGGVVVVVGGGGGYFGRWVCPPTPPPARELAGYRGRALVCACERAPVRFGPSPNQINRARTQQARV